MYTNLHLRSHALAIFCVLLLLIADIPLMAQPDCASYRSQPFNKIEKDYYYYPSMSPMNEVDYSLGNKFYLLQEGTDLYYIDWTGHYITIATYDNNLTLIRTGTVHVPMEDIPYPKSNLRVFVLGESLYISYLQENPGTEKNKSVTLFIQEVDLSTFTLVDDKLALFTENINQDMDIYPYIDIRQNLILAISDNKEYLSILFFGRDKSAPAVIKYQIYNSALVVKFSGEAPVNEITDRIVKVTTHVNNKGDLAVGMKLNKVGRVGENNENTFRIFLFSNGHNTGVYDMEDKLGYATDIKLFITEQVLTVDCDWQYYTNEKPSGSITAIRVYDLQTGKAFAPLAENVLSYLPEQEKSNFNYGKSAKTLDELGQSFKLMQVASSQGGVTYCLFRYEIPEKYHLKNLKTEDLFVYYLIQFDAQMEKQWAHLIYFPTNIYETMLCSENKVTLLVQGFSNPGCGNTTNSFEVFKATNETCIPDRYLSYVVQLNENGEAVVSDFIKACGDYNNVFNFDASYYIEKYRTFILIKPGAEKWITKISF